jgi:hypothetical protein
MRLLTMATGHPDGFEVLCQELEVMFMDQSLRQRGEWQAQRVGDNMATRELNHVIMELPIPNTIDAAVAMVTPNVPWAEEHFNERVGGVPLNPPPSAERWPFAVKNHAEHTVDRKFSHTYPERFWPRWPVEMWESDSTDWEPREGIRGEYGDLDTLVEVLVKNPDSRQVYLPVWFPEDLTLSAKGQRVPCTLGYHFLNTRDGLDCTYTIRSCDYMRHFRDDVYMAMRLTQWVVNQYSRLRSNPKLVPGKLYMHIMNFHTFAGDDEALDLRISGRDPRVYVGGGD